MTPSHRLICGAFPLLLVASALLPGLHAQTIPGWTLVWSDEFAQADGTPPDATKWGYDIGGGGWGNNEIQYYTNSTNNSRIEGGELIIEAREESIGGRDHTSARLLTKGKWDWTYGRFEARAKVPSGEGLWPAFWMLGADIDTVGWPTCGEIDVMEQLGRLPKEVFGTIHGPNYSAGDSIGGTYNFVADVADDYHTFVVEWDPDLIRWYVDGINYFSASPASLGTNSWVFDHDHFLILNLAIGGNFGGPLDPSVTFPKQLRVDYVRVYTRSQPDPGLNTLQNPGFEIDGLGAWVGYAAGGANKSGGYVESTSDTYFNGGNGGGDNVLTHSGQHAVKVFGDFIGGLNDNGFYQDLNAAPGSVWDAECWALTHPQDLMSGSNTAWVEVTFRDASATALALFRSPVLTSGNVTPGAWANLQVTEEYHPTTLAYLGSVSELQAPAGTATVRYQVVYRQPGNDGGSMYFDDFSLTQQGTGPAPPFDMTITPGTVVSWTAANAGSTYQPQKSTDNVVWNDLGNPISGNTVTSAFDPDDSPFHQVVETAPPGLGNGVLNPGFETTEAPVHPSPGAPNWTIAAPEDTNPADGTASMTVEASYATSSPHAGSRMLVLESTTPSSPAPVTPPNVNVRSDLIEVDGNTAYTLSFYAAHVVKIGGANPQMNIRYYNNAMTFIGQSGYESFSSLGSAWTQVQKSFTTPGNARWVNIEWIQALGAGNGWHWVTLIDSVDLPVTNAPGGQSTLPATAEAGLEISWDTEFGSDYQVQATTTAGGFTNFGAPVAGNGTTASMVDLLSSPTKVYRVEKIPAP